MKFAMYCPAGGGGLLVNPSFETAGSPPASWTKSGTAAATQDATHVVDGSMALKVVPDGAYVSISQTVVSAATIANYVGKRFTFCGWVWPQTTGDVLFRLRSKTTWYTGTSWTPNTWNYFATWGVIPSDATNIMAIISCEASRPAANPFWVDSCAIVFGEMSSELSFDRAHAFPVRISGSVPSVYGVTEAAERLYSEKSRVVQTYELNFEGVSEAQYKKMCTFFYWHARARVYPFTWIDHNGTTWTGVHFDQDDCIFEKTSVDCYAGSLRIVLPETGVIPT